MGQLRSVCQQTLGFGGTTKGWRHPEPHQGNPGVLVGAKETGMVEVSMLIAGGLETDGFSGPFPPKPPWDTMNTRWEGTSRVICSSPAWPKHNLDRRCPIVVPGF